MKIFFYGDTNQSSSGSWFYVYSLQKLGHEVTAFDHSVSLAHYEYFFYRLLRRGLKGIDFLSRYVHSRNVLKSLRSKDFELVIIGKGSWLCPFVFDYIHKSSFKKILISHDDFFSLYYNNWSFTQWRSLTLFDRVYSTRMSNVEELKDYVSISWSPFAYSVDFQFEVNHLDIPLRRSKEQIITFVGGFESDRLYLLERLAELHVNLLVRAFGPGWEKIDSNFNNFKVGGAVWGEDYVREIKSADVSVVFLRKQNRDEYTVRSLEIPALGSCFVAEDTDTHRKLFAEYPRDALFEANNYDSFESAILSVLNNKGLYIDSVKKVRKSLHEYTYDNCVKKWLSDLGLI